jgi:uncharacterized protein
MTAKSDPKEIVMSTPIESLMDTKTILLTTYKRDGTAVSTPVSIAFEGDRAFFRSYDKAGKTKRLRNNRRVEVAAATFRGRPTGPVLSATATLLSAPEERTAGRALARRHRLLQGVLVPLAHRLLRYKTMHYELRPDARVDAPVN